MRERLVVATLTAAAIAAVASCTDDVGPTEVVQFTASLNKLNEPSGDTITSTATGTATLSAVGGVLVYRIEVANLTDATAAHVHGPAPAGVNAGVKVNLCGTTTNGDPTSPPCAPGTVSGVLAAGVAGLTPAAGMSFDSLLVLLRNGQAYVNVHTAVHPGGEIRGQVARQ